MVLGADPRPGPPPLTRRPARSIHLVVAEWHDHAVRPPTSELTRLLPIRCTMIDRRSFLAAASAVVAGLPFTSLDLFASGAPDGGRGGGRTRSDPLAGLVVINGLGNLDSSYGPRPE